MAEVFVGLGSNLGDRPAWLRRGLAALGARGLRLRACSGFHLTAPVGGPPQPHFVNAVARCETALPPHAVLGRLLAAERRAGRVRTVAQGPRTLDLDLLWYGGHRLDTPRLELPHPRATSRRFVLAPWAELTPRLVVDGAAVREHLASLD